MSREAKITSPAEKICELAEPTAEEAEEHTANAMRNEACKIWSVSFAETVAHTLATWACALDSL